MTIKETNELNLLRDTLQLIHEDVREIRNNQHLILKEVSGIDSRLGVAESSLNAVQKSILLDKTSHPQWATLIFQSVFNIITIGVALWTRK